MRKIGEMIFVTAVMIVISFIITTFISMRTLDRVIDANMVNSTKIIAATVHDGIHSTLLRASHASTLMSQNSFLIQQLIKEHATPQEEMAQTMEEHIAGIIQTMDCDTVYIVSFANNTLYTPEGTRAVIPLEQNKTDAWIRDFIATGKDSNSNSTFTSTISPLRMIYFNNRIKDTPGNTIGMCSVGLDAARLAEVLAEHEKRYKATLCITDPKGKVLLDAKGIPSAPQTIKLTSADSSSREFSFTLNEQEGYQISRQLELLDGYLVVRNENPGGRQAFSSLVRENIIGIGITMVILLVIACLVIAGEKRKMQHKAVTDPLTGVSNRAGIEQETKAFMTSGRGMGAMFVLDIDYFKNVNDALGHTMGDEVLKDTAKYLCTSFRGRDMVGRLSGDEFMVFTPGLAQMSTIENKADELVRNAVRVVGQDGKTVPVTISVGVAVYPQHGKDYKTLYQHADLALYQAKEQGRNTWCIYGRTASRGTDVIKNK